MNYLALTIGPLYETMKYCQKTREIWVGSYFFSYCMKNLIKKLMEDGSIKLIIPYVDADKKILDEYFEEGVFHDRFIATSNKDKSVLLNMLEDTISYTLKKVINDFDLKDSDYDAMKHYLQYSYIVATEEELCQETKKENVIFAIDSILDTMELQNSFDFNNSTKTCNINQKDYKNRREGCVNPLAKLQYEAREVKYIPKAISNTNIVFKPISKIAISNIWDSVKSDIEQNKELSEILKKLEKDVYIEKDGEEDIYDTFYALLSKNYKDKFKQHHKYYTVIYADGDKMGSTIRKIYNEEDRENTINKFSQNIYSYIREGDSLSKMLNDFGGMVIYAGGDDLLAFAPIFGKDGTTIFDLLEKISIKFKNTMKKDLDLANDVSLSFGLNIHYYKSPMIEAIDSAYDLLMKAKEHNTEKHSGSISLSLTKHSGQNFGATFFLDDNNYEKYKKLFNDELNNDNIMSLPHNIQYKLKNAEYLICDIYKNNKLEVANKRLDALFENSIKDESHTSNVTTALTQLQEYIKIIQPSNKKSFDNLISQLAIIKFLRGDN